MPKCYQLIGVPGSGKSMLLHSIVLSIISSGANLHICDPKMVEFSKYSYIKNVRTTTHDSQSLKMVLSYLIGKMSERYAKYQKNNCSDISDSCCFSTNSSLCLTSLIASSALINSAGLFNFDKAIFFNKSSISLCIYKSKSLMSTLAVFKVLI